MLIPVVLALLTAAAPPQDPGRGVIRGTVQSEPSGLPIPLAVVEADDGRHTVHAIADSTGAYRLNVAAGTQTLRVRHLEHAPTEMDVLVPAGGEVALDVALVHRPIALAPLRVIRPIDPRADSTAAHRPDLGVVIDHQAVENAGGAGNALGGGFPSDPSDPGNAVDALYVRGSSANLQLVLLDGAPVYAPFHMGGLIDTFEPEVVGSAQLYLGGAPARYDGGLSYVMDLSTRSGRERAGAAGMVDMVSATGRVEGPLGAARYLGSLRTVHGGTFSQLQGEPFPYDFADGLFRFDVPLPDGGISTTLFANTEGVRVDSTQTGGRDRARWGNLAGSVRYRGRMEGADMEVTLAAGRYDADMPVRYDTRWFQLVGRSDRLRAGVDFTRDDGPVLLRYGASFERTWVEQTATAPQQFQLLQHAEVSGSATGGYVDGTWQPMARVVLRAGVRGDAFSVGSVVTMAPRLSATVLVGDGAALTLAGGRYHQYVRVPRSVPRGTILRNFADSSRIPTHLAVAGATHLSLELDQEMGGGVRLGLEGFYKRYHGLPSPEKVDTMSSTAHSSGVDVWVRRTSGALTGWFGYSLNWVWSSEDHTGLSDDFVGRQTISAGVRGVAWKRSVVGVRVAYSAPISSRDFSNLVDGGALGTGSIPPTSNTNGSVDLDTEAPVSPFSSEFLRLDAEISRTWRPRVAGRATEVTPYLRVINALDQRDGFFYRYSETGSGEGGVQPITTVPLVPVFGVNWKI